MVGGIFQSFKELKRSYRLGRSKYKTNFSDPENLSPAQENSYITTLFGVIDEATIYDLIEEKEPSVFTLTDSGRKLISVFDSRNPSTFNEKLFPLIERKLGIFRDIIESLYKRSERRQGLLIFPSYSPRLLGFEKSKVRTTQDILDYSGKLVVTLEQDIQKYLLTSRSLSEKNEELISDLIRAELLAKDASGSFNPKFYDRVTKRFRDFWTKVFLTEIYGYEYSWSTFERWVYRGKQIGIIHATEFYPGFSGKIIYPTSVIVPRATSDDFKLAFSYDDNQKLYVHAPRWNVIDEKFVKCLVDSYFDLRHPTSGYFISLPSLRELVCYKLRISEKLFEAYLGETYKLNLIGQLKNIRISLDVDKHPDDTKAMYLTKEPVMVEGKFRNIISIDVAKRGKI